MEMKQFVPAIVFDDGKIFSSCRIFQPVMIRKLWWMHNHVDIGIKLAKCQQ